MDELKTADYIIYKLITVKNEHMHVAVSKKFQKEVEKLIEEYGCLEDAPIDKTVRGIFLEGPETPINPEVQENDITVNQLRKI